MKKLFYLFTWLLLLGGYAHAQSTNGIALTPTGTNKTYAPLVSVTNSNGNTVSLLGTKKDTIKAGTFVNSTRPYRFKLSCTLVTPAVSIPTLTASVKLGTATLNLMSGVGLVGGLTGTNGNGIPFTVEGTIYPISPTQQYVFASVTQTNGTVLNLSVTNSEQFAIWNLNTSSDLIFDITASYGGFTILGTANLTSRVFERFAY